jgi:DNA-binding NarL/FixJ family response regulator
MREGPSLSAMDLPALRAMCRPKKALLVDDHALLRESLMLLLDQRLPAHRWCDAATLAATLRCLQNQPDMDVVLLNLDLPDSRGLETLKCVRRAAPLVPVVVLSAQDDRRTVRAALDHGAAACLTRTVGAAQLVRSLQQVLAGGVVLPDTSVPGDDAGAVGPDFSDRQRDVLRLLIEGQPNKLIARALGLTDATVKTHLQLIYRKLNVESRTQAVLAATRWRIRL